MNASEILPFSQWSDVNKTERFISIMPLSGYRIIQPEDDCYVIYLEPDASDEELGRSLLETLARSRFIFPPDPAFSEAERYMRCHRNLEKDFMRRYGYKTKREAYQNLDWCRVRRSVGQISIRPHERDDKPEYFRDLPAEKTVVIPATDDPLTLGAALRLALDRCE